ncbi:T9SS type A sorting domain-containing protein [uncultured Winogradskyella sp.]|uniref:T9SS type A sorting domain-containing protein n=1 Tax=uncultured Winogradskyella sp. TaxID=395353 RepID=UPI00262F1B6D|nr:T9SS type A sorting domain-containing protein [uncultured Winogradskyella sp.]
MKKVLTLFILLMSLNLLFAQDNCNDIVIFKDPLGFPGSYQLPNNANYISGSREALSSEKCKILFSNSNPGFTSNLPSNTNDPFISYQNHIGSTYLRLNDKNPNTKDGDDVIGLRTKFQNINNSTVHITASLEMQNLHINELVFAYNPELAPHFRIVITDVLNNTVYTTKCIESSDLNIVNPNDLIYKSLGFETFSVEVPESANGRDIYVDFIAADCQFTNGEDYAMAYIESVCLENDSQDINIPDDPCEALSVNIITDFPNCNIFEDSNTFEVCGSFTALDSTASPNIVLNITNNSNPFGSSSISITPIFDNVDANGLGSGTFCVTLNENSFNPADDYEINAYIYIPRVLNCTQYSETYSLPLEPCNPPVTCGISIYSVVDYNWIGQGNVAFVANTQLVSGWSITSSNFEVTFNNGTVTNYNGYLNPEGTPQILINVDCNNVVRKVKATVYSSNSSGLNCSDTMTQKFYVCGTSGFSKNSDIIKIVPNPIKSGSNIKIQGLEANDVEEIEVIDMFGNIRSNQKLKSNTIRLGNLRTGIYFIKISTKQGIIQKRIIVN